MDCKIDDDDMKDRMKIVCFCNIAINKKSYFMAISRKNTKNQRDDGNLIKIRKITAKQFIKRPIILFFGV